MNIKQAHITHVSRHTFFNLVM